MVLTYNHKMGYSNVISIKYMQLLTCNLHAYHKLKIDDVGFHESTHSPFSLSLIAKASISAIATIGPVITHFNRYGKSKV